MTSKAFRIPEADHRVPGTAGARVGTRWSPCRRWPGRAGCRHRCRHRWRITTHVSAVPRAGQVAGQGAPTPSDSDLPTGVVLTRRDAPRDGPSRPAERQEARPRAMPRAAPAGGRLSRPPGCGAAGRLEGVDHGQPVRVLCPLRPGVGPLSRRHRQTRAHKVGRRAGGAHVVGQGQPFNLTETPPPASGICRPRRAQEPAAARAASAATRPLLNAVPGSRRRR